jgi:hypothetical protein
VVEEREERSSVARRARPQDVSSRRRWLALLAGVACGATPLLVVVESTTVAYATSATSALVPLPPCRLLDTRLGEHPAAGASVRLETSGACGVPDDATSVVVTLTATRAAAAGFLTGWDGKADRPVVSNLNYGAGETRANTAVLPLHDGGFTLFTQSAADLIVDVAGAFVPRAAASAGRFVPVPPVRVIDTRTTGALAPDATVRVPLPDGVPADAVAVAVTLTTAGGGAGYFTAAPAGAARPNASVLNTDAAGQTRAVGAILPVSPDGLDVYTSAGAPVIADVTGYFTGASAPRSSNGLYVAEVPTRLIDTRTADPIYANGSILVEPGDGAAAVLNVTMTANRFAGFLSAVPAATAAARDATSSVNTDRRMTTAASVAIVATSTLGVAVTSSVTTHAVIDVFGRFTGSPVEAVADATTIRNAPVDDPPVRALLVGDSTMAGIRWYGSSRVALAGDVAYTLEAESCRRLAQPSCRSREGGHPRPVAQVVAAATGPVDVLVVQAGYDDAPGSFVTSFERVVGAARAKGIGQVVWLTYRSSATYVFAGFNRSLGNGYAAMNASLRELVASGAYPEVILADYERYTSQAASWFEADGIHLTRLGAYGTADYIARHIAAANALPCPAPATPGGPPDRWCSVPDALPAVDVGALYQL